MAEIDENLVIYAYKNIDDTESGRLFTVPHKVYTHDDFLMKGAAAAIPSVLLSYGTVAANMPNDGTGAGGFCYLVNLPAMRPPSIELGQIQGLTPAQQAALKRPAPRLSPRDVVEAIKSLVKNVKAETDDEQKQLQSLNDVVEKLS